MYSKSIEIKRGSKQMKREKWMKGCYRINYGDHYAHIAKNTGERMWKVSIHDATTGTLRRYAGLWDTLKDATEEAEHVLERM